MSKQALTLLVIADPAAPFLSALSRLPQDLRLVVSDDPQKLKASAPEADAILYAHVNDSLIATVLPLAQNLRWIHCLWTGVEGIIKPELLQHPAPLTNGRGAFREPLADWVAAVMLFFAFDLRRLIQQQEKGLWEPFIGATLKQRVLGIVGYGSIGSAAATRARQFGMKIAAMRRRPERFERDRPADQIYAPGQLKELARVSDYILVATPLTPETRGLIDEEIIAAMKPTAVIMNIGRGPVIDEVALIRALDAGKIRGAALDVFSTEPLPPGHPFWQMDNVLLSPHTADRIEGFLDPAFDCFFENLARFRKNEPLLNIVDKRAGY
jgi:phosphoglycerate dehydrogenase-like enzyme